MGKYTGITSMCAIPSDSANYIPISRRPPVTDQVVIGTPGTIKKWISAKKLATRDVKILVFDEADHMLAEVGFVYLFNLNDCRYVHDHITFIVIFITWNDFVSIHVMVTVQVLVHVQKQYSSMQ